jgi:4-amino-4-deoxy-L-arabinose transferase-like glycosyltransferase
MARLIILIAVIGIALILWHKITNAKGAERKKMILWSTISGVLAVLGLLAITGHLNIITALIAGAVALLPRAMQLAKYLPYINQLYQKRGQQHAQNSRQNQQGGSQPSNGKHTMSAEQAREVLGLKPGCSKEDIILAHRRMMQKVHPDRGGSDYLAAQINTAKDILLG